MVGLIEGGSWLVWLISCAIVLLGMWLNMELLPIPAAWASGMPANLMCDFYFVGKWNINCAIESGIFYSPIKTIICLVGILFLSFILCKNKFIEAAFSFAAPFVGMSGFISLIICVFGYAGWQYCLFALVKIGVLFPLFWLANRKTAKEKLRQKKLNQSIDIEIAERLKERNEGRD
ncbi:hypothetical protein [Chromobacterium vaccinii]|uniref:hypothetical protein n=1 Tax=Chromobacterium vaccinii TaxID=1108595 RepID=UPI0031D72F8E